MGPVAWFGGIAPKIQENGQGSQTVLRKQEEEEVV